MDIDCTNGTNDNHQNIGLHIAPGFLKMFLNKVANIQNQEDALHCFNTSGKVQQFFSLEFLLITYEWRTWILEGMLSGQTHIQHEKKKKIICGRR